MKYIKKIKNNEIITKIKISVLKYNMDISILDVITDEDLIREKNIKEHLKY